MCSLTALIDQSTTHPVPLAARELAAPVWVCDPADETSVEVLERFEQVAVEQLLVPELCPDILVHDDGYETATELPC